MLIAKGYHYKYTRMRVFEVIYVFDALHYIPI